MSASGKPGNIAVRIREAGLAKLEAFRMLEHLVALGPRPACSVNARRAVRWARKTMQELGFDNVCTEPVTVRGWERGTAEEAVLLQSASQGTVPLRVAALGGSVGTLPDGLAGEVVEFKSLDDLDASGDAAKGRIVFLNRPMDPSLLDTFDAYGKAADQRVRGAARAAKVGAIAVLVRSLTLRVDSSPHTGIMVYEEDVPKIPAAALATADADALSQALQTDGRARVFLKMACRETGEVKTDNVMGEITGTEHPEEVVVVGGHIDSWDLGPGAHDDGAGCVQSVEALRLLKELGLKPRRTIRAVMFMDEEFGGTGGKAYADEPARKKEKTIAAIESDRGGFLPLGFTVNGPPEALERVRSWLPALGEAGILRVTAGHGGTDVEPLAQSGCVTIGLVPDSQRYFDVHHCDADTIESVNPRELQLGAIALAILAWNISEHGI